MATKTIVLCDICGRETPLDERIRVKRRDGAHRFETGVDMCADCWQTFVKVAKVRAEEAAKGGAE